LKDALLCTTSLKEYSDKGLRDTAGENVRGSRLFVSGANWTAQRNGDSSSVVFNIFNAIAQVYIKM
jgi:hypothetical protein